MRFRLSDLTPGLNQPLWAAAALVSCVAPWQMAWAQDALLLKSSPLLEDKLRPDAAKAAPVFLQADRIVGRPDLDTVLEGRAVLRKAGTVIQADRLTYDQPTDRAVATGNVRINRGGNIYEGPLLDLKVDAFEGFFTAPSYQFLQNEHLSQRSRARLAAWLDTAGQAD